MSQNPYQDEDDYSDEDDQSNSDEDDETAFNQLYARNQAFTNVAPEITHERLEWQQMLQSVLLGEVIKSEKKRLSSSDKFTQEKPTQEIWLSLRALLRGRTMLQEQKSLDDSRKEIEGVLKMVMEFKIEEDEGETALRKVAEVLKNIDRIESLYTTRAEMILAHPEYGSIEFQTRLDALNSWCTVTRSLSMQYKILRNWTGSEDLQIARRKSDEDTADGAAATSADATAATTDNNKHNKEDPRNDTSFVERLLKESALQDTFDKRTLSALNSLLMKSKETLIYNSTQFKEMNLPSFISQLRRLAYFPISLVEEALKLRLENKSRMQEPPKQMVDTMMEDYRGLLSLACRVKREYQELTHTAPGWKLDEDEPVDQNYDNVLMESVRFYFKLISWKLNLEKENNLREKEVMEKEWAFLQETVCQAVDKADWECAEQFCSLTNRLLADVMHDYISKLKISPESVDGGIEVKYTKLLHTMRMRARKLLQFARFFMSQFENAAEYVVDTENMDKFITCLVETGHFLVYTGAFEEDRIYIIASPSLYGREDVIQTLIRACFANNKQPQPSTPLTPSDLNIHSEYDDYILIFSPWQNIMWTGEVVEVPTPFIHLGIKTRRVRLTTGDAQKLASAKAAFWTAVQHSGIEIIQEHRAHIPRINKELYKIKMTVFKLADSTISSVSTIRDQTIGLGCQELVEECFSFASDFGIRASKFLELAVRLQLDLKLVRLAIDWICFITDDCIPSDRKTFRWAVAALEFVHLMTRGVNILALNESEFATLQSKVARCVALLISHFDVLGTRYTYELQLKEDQQRRRGLTAKRNSYMTSKNTDKDNITTSSTFGAANDAASTGGGGVIYIRDAWMRKISEIESKRTEDEQERKIIGKILDDQKPEDQSLMFLAPSSSNISFSWQQGRFIGAGTFGSVYLAINLDTSTVMAVKEIRFPDSSSLSALHKSIKEEMSVMEMLQHRNIVQYYGMEVHRDRVYIFMEYCENGSLGALLDHGGRIEDEVYIVDYAYQLLSGLAYLHGNNVVHRDIKPDNILIDYQGQLKLTDFGASKILVKGQKTMGRATMNMHVGSLAGTPMYMAPEVITGSDTGRKGSMDIWSLGCCIVQMATGRRPWSTLENEWSVMYHVVTGHPPLPDASQLSSPGIDFLKKCFVRDPNKRPSAEELLNHPWITSYLESYSEETQLPPPQEGENGDVLADNHRWVDEEGGGGGQNRSVNGDEMPPMMRSINSAHSLERPLIRSIPNSLAIDGMVRSIPNSLAIDGMAASLENGAQAQAYFQNIAAQHAKDTQWDPNASSNNT
ncbi:STE/STE11/SSK protein kinase [Mucor circinelloides 1006PhL]|uniref:STE/STE11/SSK protein kinase n=1 Tax=Mucor circinelloides f. circinelloides (strain 1006PhL) TaxID=1220926 RepID=S2IXU0_MUCC1|nr:STE/STE11/SSK protein kinase [Mucor circinelloides 1006PhL]